MTLYLPDISSYDVGIDLTGALAVMIKVTQGAGYANPYFASELSQARAHGALPLAYHFLEEGAAADQADWCRAHDNDLPVTLDWEPMDPPGGSSYPGIGDAVTFIRRFRSRGGTCHLMYLPEWYWARGAFGLGGASLQPLIDLGMVLWSSNYGTYTDHSGGAGWQSYGGMTPLVWQYTETMQFGGLASVDFSAFRGTYAGAQDAGSVAATLAEFASIAQTGKYPSPPVVPPVPPGKVHIPRIRGMSAGAAHNRLMAAHLVPMASAGQKASWIVSGSTPAGGQVATGSRVAIVAAAAPELREGAAGEPVAIAQEDMNKAGAHLGADGRFGGVTLAAVYKFQADNGLYVDGKIGPATWQRLGEQ